MIGFGMIFPIQSLEFTKSLKFENNLKKNYKKYNYFFIISPKKSIYIDAFFYIFHQIFPKKPSEFKISLTVESYDTAENCRNSYVVEKRIAFNLFKISILHFDSTN